MDIKLKVTREKFDENFSIDEWFDLASLTNAEVYEKMLLFVVDENGEYIPREQAKKMFRKVPKKEWDSHISAFYKAISDSFVSPTNGGS